MVSSTPRPYFTPGKDPVAIVQEAGWAPGPVWTGGKSRPIGIRSPDRPARSQSLYRLSYPAHSLMCGHGLFKIHFFLTTPPVACFKNTVEYQGYKEILNWKLYDGKCLLPNLKFFPGVTQENHEISQ